MTDQNKPCPSCGAMPRWQQRAPVDQRERVIAELRKACQAALYLIGTDADRKAIGEKPWGKHKLAIAIPCMLRDAIAKVEGREPQQPQEGKEP
ncbi:hypothetical protein LCGC14_0325930 [marine sediment metagenome]|uniref:Uncharacterized protein n=1 Tax=marine sediment metagenome TaxID=412755 RepID=A0A0F9U0J1_9ZZZZ